MDEEVVCELTKRSPQYAAPRLTFRESELVAKAIEKLSSFGSVHGMPDFQISLAQQPDFRSEARENSASQSVVGIDCIIGEVTITLPQVAAQIILDRSTLLQEQLPELFPLLPRSMTIYEKRLSERRSEVSIPILLRVAGTSHRAEIGLSNSAYRALRSVASRRPFPAYLKRALQSVRAVCRLQLHCTLPPSVLLGSLSQIQADPCVNAHTIATVPAGPIPAALNSDLFDGSILGNTTITANDGRLELRFFPIS